MVRVLDLLAEAPRERLTLTQIAHDLRLNKPTCLGILTALVDAEYVTRDESKAYGLGPALLRLGAAAESGHANLDLVRPSLAALHETTGLSCVLSAAHRDQIVIVDRIGAVAMGDRRDFIAERFPLVPPLGLVNIAWTHDDVTARWIETAPLIPIVDRDRARAVIDRGRECGYLVQRLTRSTSSNVVLASLLASDMPSRIIDELVRYLPPVDWSEFITELPDDGAAELPVATISAPVFDRHGRQQYTLTAVPVRTAVRAEQCRRWADAVVSAARTATAALGG